MQSSHDYSLVLSAEAVDDLVDILNYTFAEHGEGQWKAYTALLDTALEHIHRNPKSGYQRSNISQKYLAWNAGMHIMIYRIEQRTIYLVRVLHQRMDFTNQFQG